LKNSVIRVALRSPSRRVMRGTKQNGGGRLKESSLSNQLPPRLSSTQAPLGTAIGDPLVTQRRSETSYRSAKPCGVSASEGVLSCRAKPPRLPSRRFCISKSCGGRIFHSEAEKNIAGAKPHFYEAQSPQKLRSNFEDFGPGNPLDFTGSLQRGVASGKLSCAKPG
jgi:hypothetical protein